MQFFLLLLLENNITLGDIKKKNSPLISWSGLSAADSFLDAFPPGTLWLAAISIRQWIPDVRYNK